MKKMLSAISQFDGAVLQSVLAGLVSVDRDERDECEEQDLAQPVEWNLPGFVGSARVGTAFGDLPIEALRLRDEIRTTTGAIARVQWIDKLHLDEDFLAKHPSAQPVRIPADAFGKGRPMKDMLVSPRQTLCPDAHVATRFPTAQVLCSQGIGQRAQKAGLTYYRFHCGVPVTVRMEGVLVRIDPNNR